MPEYILPSAGTVNTAPPVTFDDLDAFTQGYIEALFFTESSPAWDKADIEARPAEWDSDLEEGMSDGSLPGDAGFADLDPATLESIMADCAAWQATNAELLAKAYGHGFPARVIGDGTLPNSHRPAWDYDAAAAGRDYWFTHNGHGVGFWDRGLGDLGDALSEAAGRGEANAYYDPDSGKVHL